MATQYPSKNSGTTTASDETPTLMNFHLPEGAVQRGLLFQTKHPDYLREGIVEIELPTGICLDISWHPQLDPAGSYVITVFQADDWDDQLQEQVFAREFDSLKATVEELADRYAKVT